MSMKKLFIAMVLVMVGTGGCLLPEPTEPTRWQSIGFEYLYWGMSAEEFVPTQGCDGNPYADCSVYPELKDFKRPAYKLKVGKLQVSSVTYSFFYNQLYAVYVRFDKGVHFTKIKSVLLDKLGPLQQPPMTGWLLGNTFVILSGTNIYIHLNGSSEFVAEYKVLTDKCETCVAAAKGMGIPRVLAVADNCYHLCKRLQ